MSTITIQDIQKNDLITELNLEDIDTIKGGWVPVAVGIAAGSAFVTGIGLGIDLYNSTKD